MLLLDTFLNAASLSPLLVSAIPVSSRALNPAAAAPNAYLSLFQFNSTNSIPNPNPSAYQPVCFQTRPGLNLTAVAEDCSTILNDVILRIDGPFEKRAFLHRHYMNSNGQWVPALWVFGQCTIYAESAQSNAVDLLTFFEVALTAHKILLDCVTSPHGRRQGGLMPIGRPEQSFFVSVQGLLPGSNVVAINDTDIPSLPGFEVSKPTLDAKPATHGPTGLRPRTLVSLNQALSPSNSTGNLKVQTDDDIDCFPIGSRLPDAHADDCKLIINYIILGMKDPFREQTWGYTDTVDIDLSLPEARWVFKDCYIRVKNIDERQVDRFRPVDVAEVAQSILQKCVVDTKQRLGGNADIGRLPFPRKFYVVVSGTAKRSGESLGNDTINSLPSGGSRTLDSRASLISPEDNSLPEILPEEGLIAGKRYPVNCFDPASVHILKRVIVSDCNFIINDIILRLPNPMKEQTFGYTDAVDINLSEGEYNHWIYGQCAVFIRNIERDTTRRDRFRFLDVAYTALRIVGECVEGAKYALGGVADVGRMEDNFYVGVSGIDHDDPGNGRILELASGTEASSPSSAILVSPPGNRTEATPYNFSDTESADLVKRSSNISKLLQASNEFAPSVRCFGSGMPAAQKVDLQDCTEAAMVLLSDPKILVPQLFTTEPTGGIEMPFVKHKKSCYLMMDTGLELSVSDSMPLLKMVYWALEIMLTCISGREQGFGGVSKLDKDKGIFVSVTGVNPIVVRNRLASLSDESTSAIVLENTSLQIVDLGQS